ncbi:hypothetical protein APA_326 [Pseudanabaena sp. lw0831]|nr:hypothetical protein APA_326 [Pseudanabaena sp. lw0831]
MVSCRVLKSFRFRQYSTQEVQGFLFWIGQPQANLWVHRYQEIPSGKSLIEQIPVEV